jgi:hypothetical protein
MYFGVISKTQCNLTVILVKLIASVNALNSVFRICDSEAL